MFRLEKIFQNDDLIFINFFIIIKSLVFFLSIYIFSILEFNSIYDLLNFSIFKKSEFYNFSIYSTIFYFISSFFFKIKKKYSTNFLSFLLYDILPLFLSIILCFSLFFILKFNINISINFIYLLIFISFNLLVLKKISNFLYNLLIIKNIIQRNIILVGTANDIKTILKENKDKINVYKCCLINIKNEKQIKEFRLEFKIPCFFKFDDIRSILEYHSLGQVWILDNTVTDINFYLTNFLKYSVDLLIVDVKNKPILGSENLINGKHQFKEYEISRFHGFKLFIKIMLDKIFSLFFLILFFPVIIIALLFIYLEDGFPLFFTQDRTGWDGRRFKIYKIRSLRNISDTKIQVIRGDNRITKIGSFIRRFSIDELPQFYNVLIGDMSIVGPRPHPVHLDIKYSNIFSGFLSRHKSSPGLTGWAQVCGYRGATPTNEIMEKRMEHDLWYLNNWTIWLDLYIMIKTFYVIFTKPGT